MSSISFGSNDDTYLLSMTDLNDASDSSSPCLVDDSTSSASKSYTSEQFKQFLLGKDQRFHLKNSDSIDVSTPRRGTYHR